ncbi:MAG: 3'-5' exoribonuclease [Bacteroidales bacterium]|jgi:DNA polymerase-3 subunit epsilon|nr:3'-5' exoribonuclease [Bacteroidales bacterium]
MDNFIAIDFETANECPSSICSIGAVLVTGKRKVNEFYSLIHPEPEYYKWFCQKVHGLDCNDTENAPVFPFAWEELKRTFGCIDNPECGNLPFVAHNSHFDEGCLKAAFNVYSMDYPDYDFKDTLSASRKFFGKSIENHQLQTVAAACGYDLTNHHNALADAIACACIAVKIL